MCRVCCCSNPIWLGRPLFIKKACSTVSVKMSPDRLEMKMSSNRESFGDTGIDWAEAVTEVDSWLASASSGATTARSSAYAGGIDATAAKAPSTDRHAVKSSFDDARKIMGDENSQSNNQYNCRPQKSELTMEQVMRMEENRRNALEKLRLKAQLHSSSQAVVTKQQSTQLRSTHTAPDNPIQSQSTNNDALVSLECTMDCPHLPIVTDEQRARMEENKRKALEKKHRIPQLAIASSTTIPVNVDDLASPINATSSIRVIPPITDDGCARMGASENQMQPLQTTSPPTSDLQQLHGSVESSGPGVEKQDMESFAEDTTKCAGENHDSALEKLEIMQSHDDDRKPPARELLASDVKISPVLHHTKSPTKKSALPPIPPELRYDESRLLPTDDDYIDSLIENAKLDETLLNGWTLFDHQKEGVRRGLRMRRLILAFDMGLGEHLANCLLSADSFFGTALTLRHTVAQLKRIKGKTIIGCVWGKAFLNTFERMKIFVIAPVSLHDEWKRTAIDATGLKLGVDGKMSKKGKAKKKKEEEEDYERTVTGKRRKKAKKNTESDSENECDSSGNIHMHIFSWDCISACTKVILDVPNYVVIADEAHYMQSMESNRTKEALKLVSQKK